MNGCNHLQLELLVAGELEKAETVEVTEHLKKCEHCAVYVTTLKKEQTDFLKQHPFSSFNRAHAPVKQLPWYRRVSALLMKPAFLTAAAALVVAVTIIPFISDNRPQQQSVTRFKGGNSISYIYKENGQIFNQSPEDLFGADDQLQIIYSSVSKQFLSLVSIDSKGTVSMYHPQENSVECSIQINSGASQTYPGSIIFDATKGHELIVALFSKDHLSSAVVQTWLQKAFNDEQNIVTLKNIIENSSALLNTTIRTLLVTKE